MQRRRVLTGAGSLSLLPRIALAGPQGEVVTLVRTDGAEIATQAFGSANDPAMVLIMGATASMLGWPDAFCAALADRGFYVIRFDHRDTGQSTTVAPGQATYAVEDMAADVIGILDAYGVKRAHLMGMSLGGLVAQILALKNPGRVRSLVLFAAEPLGWDGPPLPYISQAFLDHFSELGTLDWSNEADVAAFLLKSERLSAGSGHVFEEKQLRLRIAQILARTNSPASMFNHASLDLREDWSGRFRQISVPVLVMHGADDPILPPANGRAIANGIQGARLVVMPGVGHEIPSARFEFMADAIAGYLAR